MKTRSGASPRNKRGGEPKPVTPKYRRRLRSRKSRKEKDLHPLKSKPTKDNLLSTVVSSAMTSNVDLQFNFDMSPVRESKSSKLITRTPTFKYLSSRSPNRASPSPAHGFRSPNPSRFSSAGADVLAFSPIPGMDYSDPVNDQAAFSPFQRHAKMCFTSLQGGSFSLQSPGLTSMSPFGNLAGCALLPIGADKTQDLDTPKGKNRKQKKNTTKSLIKRPLTFDVSPASDKGCGDEDSGASSSTQSKLGRRRKKKSSVSGESGKDASSPPNKRTRRSDCFDDDQNAMMLPLQLSGHLHRGSTSDQDTSFASSSSFFSLSSPSQKSPSLRRNLSKHCNCKNSKCLKKYCVCFASSRSCWDRCKCLDCHNQESTSSQPKQSLQPQTLETSEQLTRSNLDIDADTSLDSSMEIEKLSSHGSQFQHTTENETSPQFDGSIIATTYTRELMREIRCNCRKSGCKKKYCRCFSNNVACGSQCGCPDTNCQNNKVKEYSIRRRSRTSTSGEMHLDDTNRTKLQTQIRKAGGLGVLHGSGHALTTGSPVVYSLLTKMNLRWKKMYPWLPAMSQPSSEIIKGTDAQKGSGSEQHLAGTKKLYSLWLRALAFLDDDSLLTCCFVSKHMATLSLNPRLWIMGDGNTHTKQSNSLTSTSTKPTKNLKEDITSDDNHTKVVMTVTPGGVPVMTL